MNEETDKKPSDVLWRLSKWLLDERRSTGDLARLRRMNPRNPEAAFDVLHHVLGELALRSSLVRLQRWALIVHCLALAGGRHRKGASGFGRVLVDIHYGELRLRQLLRADLEVLLDVLPRVARRISAQSLEANWWSITKLVLNVPPDDAKAEPDEADVARREIARDFVIASSAEQAAAS